MGCLIDKPSDSESTVTSDIATNKEEEKKAFKLLLLGAGGSGKSTVFRQVKFLYGNGYEDDERLKFALTIHDNMVHSIKKLIKECEKTPKDGGMADENLPSECENRLAEIKKLPDDGPHALDKLAEIGSLIQYFWELPCIKLCYSRRSRYQLPTDAIHYFFDKAETVMKKGYVPSQEDLLHCRIHSTGVRSETFEITDGLFFRLLDVGGQRSERKKWVKCFENVTAVLYVVAISEYDQLCYEDNETNRVLEALDLFEDIANSEWFADIDIVLFLNKSDLLKEKIIKVPAADYFPEYKGDNSFNSVVDFMKREFTERNQQDRQVQTEVTTATNTKDIQKVFQDKVLEILRKKVKTRCL